MTQNQVQIQEVHRQRIYPLHIIESLIRDAGLKLVVSYSDLGFSPGSESADRVHYIVKSSA